MANLKEVKKLRPYAVRTHDRARQAAITTELMETIGGSEALNG